MRRLPILIATAAVLMGTVGCSSSDSDADAPDTTASAPEATTSTTAASEPLDDQTPPTSINGITVQGDTIWIASIKDDEILQIDRESGAILQRFATDGAGPDDVAVAPDGSVWSTGFVNGDVGRIADGEYEVFTTIKPGINPLEFNADGILYIGTYGPNGELFQLDSAGEKNSFTRSLGGGLPDINGFGILADGTIIAPSGGIAGPGSAVSITVMPVGNDETGDKTIETIVDGLPGVAAGATDAEGNPFILANAVGEVYAIDVEAGSSELVQTVKQGAPFDNMSFADDGMLYLSSFIAPTITEVAPDGTERLITIGG